MVRVKAKKRGSAPAPRSPKAQKKKVKKAPPKEVKSSPKKQKVSSGGLNRLGLLRKKLQLEQELLNKGEAPTGKQIKELEKQLNESKPQEESQDVEEESPVEPSDPEVTLPEPASDPRAMDDLPTRPSEDPEVERVRDLINLSKTKQDGNVKLTPANARNFATKMNEYNKIFAAVKKEVAKVVVGQHDALRGLFRALIADGHVLVEGVPGIAKTTLIRALAKTTQCSFARIQFTPDLLPSDIVGISTYQEGRGFYTLKGPIFNNFILADEINRAPPKVQSALLESMAEKQATIAKESFPVPLPFFTMATQNPLENVGTYSLPEAQIDRFLFKLYMEYPNVDEEQRILRTNISETSFHDFDLKGVLNPDLIREIQEMSKNVYVDKKVEQYIVRIVDATRSPKKYHIGLGKYVEYGSSPRASIGLFKAARAEALLSGSSYVTPHHVKLVTFDVLRHRLILTYEGQAEGVRSEAVITEMLKKVPVP